MNEFQAGDEVRILKNPSPYSGQIGTVLRHDGGTHRPWDVELADGMDYGYYDYELELVNNKDNKKTMSKTIEKFKDMFSTEPEKSLKKAGLMEDGMVTDDGVDLYITWLMKKDEAFMKDVVKELIKDEKKSK